jgi:hypothetical protein
MAGGVSIGPRLQVEGEEEYRQKINGIIEQSKTLDAEMKALTATFGDEDTAQQRAAKSTDLLNAQLEAAKQRTELVRAMTAQATAEYEENSTQVLKWRQALASAKEQQAELERAVEENTRALSEQGETAENDGQKMATLGDQVSGLAERFGVHLPDSIKGALDHVDGFSTRTVAAMGAAAAGIGAVKLAIDGIQAGIEAVQKLNELTLEQAHWADDLLTQSAQTGLSTDLLQQLDYASKFLDFEGIDKSLVKLTQSMDSARDGAEKQAAAFQTLGVAVTDSDGQLRDNWETFKDVIDALGEVENATERDALSNDIFGKSYAELKPLIDAGTDALQDMMDAAVENGHVLDESQIQKLGEVDDAYQEYQTKLDDVKKKLAVEFAPVSTKVMEEFGDLAVKAADKLVESGMLEKIGAFIEPLARIGDSLLNLADAVLPVVTGALNVAADAFAWAAEKAAAFFDWVSRLDGATIQQTMVDSGDMGYWGDYNPAFAGYNAAGDRNWRGGLTWVGETGPELVKLPRGSQIYSNQESRQIAAAAGGSSTDTRALEASVQENTAMLRAILSELGGMRIRGRMYG